MPDLIVVTLDPAHLQLQPGGKASATIIVKNRSEEVENFSLSLEGVPPSWGEITPDQLSAFPFQEVHAQINVQPPAETQAAIYRLTICAKTQDEAGTEGRGLLEVELPAAPVIQADVTVQVDKIQTDKPGPVNTPSARPTPVRPQTAVQIELRVEPSTDNPLPPPAMQWKLRLKNAGNVLDTFGFSFNGIPQNWVSIDPVEMQLYPDEEGTSMLVVRPGADTKAATYPFTLRAFSHVNMNERTEVGLKIDVKASLGFQLEVTPHEAEIQGVRDFQVYLSSTPAANGDMWLDLSANDQDNACEYNFQPKEILLPARQRVMSTLRVKPRAVLGPNERKQYTVKVAAVPRQALAPSQSVDVRVTHTGSLPPNLTIQPQVQNAEMESDYVVVVANQSAVDVTLYFSADDPEMACEYAFLPDRRFVSANGTSSIRLHVKARAAFRGEKPKQIAFTVKATRGGELLPAATTQGQLNQLPGRPLTAQLIPPQLSSTGRAKYSTRVHNPYNGPILAWLEAHDETDALAFSVSPSRMQIPAGSDGLFELGVKPKDKLLPIDQRRVHKFTVSVYVQGLSTPTNVTGLLAQVKGTDWTTPLGKFFSGVFAFLFAVIKLLWKIIKWAIPVILILLVIIFVADLGIATLFYIVQHDNQLGPIITGLIPGQIINSLHNTMLFKDISDSIVAAAAKIMAVMQTRLNPPPTPTPNPTPGP
jgi:hypothetical protein